MNALPSTPQGAHPSAARALAAEPLPPGRAKGKGNVSLTLSL